MTVQKDVTGDGSLTQSQDTVRELGVSGEQRAVWCGRCVLFTGVEGSGKVPRVRLDSMD